MEQNNEDASLLLGMGGIQSHEHKMANQIKRILSSVKPEHLVEATRIAEQYKILPFMNPRIIKREEPTVEQPNHLRKRPSEEPIIIIEPTSKKIRKAEDDSQIETENLMDPLSYAGPDLAAEQEMLANTLIPQSSHSSVPNGYIPGVDRTCTTDFLHSQKLRAIVRKSVRKNGVKHADENVYSYIALAAQARVRDLVERMVVASKHRTGLMLQGFVDREEKMMAETGMLESRVVVSVDSRPKGFMEELEAAERSAERALRAERGYGGIVGEEDEEGKMVEAEEAMSGGEGGGKKAKGKKGKKPQVTEAVQSKLMNDASLRASGVKSYDWMNATKADPTAIVPKRKAQATSAGPSSARSGELARASATREMNVIQLAASDGSKIMRPMMKRDLYRLCLVDALSGLGSEGGDTRSLMAKWSNRLK